MTRLAGTIDGVIGVDTAAAQRRRERRVGRRPGGAGGPGPRPSPCATSSWGPEALRVLLATRHGACAAKVSATNQLKALSSG